MKKPALFLALCLVALVSQFAGAQTTQITASHIAQFGGAPVTGSFCLSPTDGSGNPINLVTTAGQQFAGTTSLCFPISNGVLSSSAVVPDVSTTQPTNACYKLTVYSNAKNQLANYACLQPSGATWSFDSYVPSSLSSQLSLSLPQYQLNGVALANQAVLNFVCSGCTNPSAGTINIPAGGGGGGGASVGATAFSPIIMRAGKIIFLAPNQPIVLE